MRPRTIGATMAPSCAMLPLLPKSTFADQTLIARFRHDLDTRQLRVKPLSVVTESAIVRLTETLSMTAVAEGVETEEQLAFLRQYLRTLRPSDRT